MTLPSHPALTLTGVDALSSRAMELLGVLDGLRASAGSATLSLELLCRAGGLSSAEALPLLRALQKHGLVLCLEAVGLIHVTMGGHQLLDELHGSGSRAEPRSVEGGA